MPLIKGKLDRGRVLIDVGVQPTLLMPNGVTPEHQPTTMDIRPRGKQRIGNVSSFEMHNSYSFVLGVWFVPDGLPDDRATGYYQFDPVSGVDFKDNADFDVLIGMDIIGQGDFATKRSGDFTWDLP